MIQPESFIAPGEQVQASWRVKDLNIILTDRRVIIGKGGSVRDIALSHIVSIEVEEKLDEVIGGIVLSVLGAILFVPNIIFLSYLGLVLVLSGIGVAIWGYYNRFNMVIIYGPRSYNFRNGDKLIEIAARIRNYIMQVRHVGSPNVPPPPPPPYPQ